MANEYLTRTPTSTGNRRVFTWSGWVKINSLNNTIRLFNASPVKDNVTDLRINTSGSIDFFDRQGSDASTEQIRWTQILRDFGSWYHILINADTTQIDAANRVRCFVNGVPLQRDATATLLNNSAAVDTPPRNQDFWRLNGAGYQHYIAANLDNTLQTTNANEFTDVFFIDGQALTPDVFGFNKQGKGYISVGSTQSTDFRPGQWVPKTPRVIKTEINRRGGFGVNGFYLPMNDSNNFGADFHGDPNSIITLNEKLPQPRVGVASTASVGLGYTDALRADPYAANLVLALPFVSGGLTSGFGDYAPSIKGSGTPKTITNNTAVSIANTASYYGSAAQFNGSHYLTIPTNTDFDFGTGDFTIEYWANYQTLSPALSDTIMGGTTTGCFGVYMSTSQWGFVSQNQASIQLSSGTIVGINQFNHFAVVRKGNTLTGYLNGVAGAASTTWTYNMTNTGLGIGAQNSGSNKITGYLQDLRVYKGVAKYTGGFDVPRPYTPVGIATWRQVPDTTANNFCTLNPLSSPSDSGLTNGNLDYTGPSAWRVKRGTFQIPTTGKWYFEARLKGSGSNNTYNGTYAAVGVCTDLSPVDGTSAIATSSNLMITDTGIVKNFTTAAVSFLDNTVNTGSALSSGDVISIQIDRDANTYNFLKNGTSINSGTMNITTGTPLNVVYISYSNSFGQMTMNFGQNPTFSGNTTAGTFTDSNSKGLFKYQPPSGFLALCEDNLPTPAISDPGKYFKTVLYTGDGASGRSIVGIGFTPDLVWIKNRTTVSQHTITDSVRGVDRQLFSTLTNIEQTSTTGIMSLNADGFSLGTNVNPTGDTNSSVGTYVAWCWRAGAGTTSTNTNGSITSVVSVNQDAGFSIVSYTGNGANATVGHGLGKAPAMYITKGRGGPAGATNWDVYHKALGSDKYLQLNSTNAAGTSTTLWQNTNPTSSVFYLSSTSGDTNGSGSTYIAYCWAEIEGFSKFGSFTGNASTDGPFIWTGFLPAWIMIKRTAGAADWVIHDSSRTSINPSDTVLRPNTSDIDLTASTLNIDFLSNGFKIRNTNGSYNNAELYIFAAFAQSPFSYSNSK